jgi:hypothetical protein
VKSDWRHVFQNTAADAAQPYVPFRVFLWDWGLADFLIEDFGETDSPQEIAARALEYLCEKGDVERNMVVCTTVVRFLEKVEATARQDPHGQRLRDLKTILEGPCSYQTFLKWAKSWYR